MCVVLFEGLGVNPFERGRFFDRDVFFKLNGGQLGQKRGAARSMHYFAGVLIGADFGG
jgi:hypothetical protein